MGRTKLTIVNRQHWLQKVNCGEKVTFEKILCKFINVRMYEFNSFKLQYHGSTSTFSSSSMDYVISYLLL